VTRNEWLLTLLTWTFKPVLTTIGAGVQNPAVLRYITIAIG